MDKRTFMQYAILHYKVKPERFNDCIDYAEKIWELLTERGYGSPQKGQERRTIDYYAKLLPEQKERFDGFWDAFRKKDGKQDAAKVWLRIDPDEVLYKKIIEGAKREARLRNDRGTTPVWAEKWLNQARWEDAAAEHQKPVTEPEDVGKKAHALRMVEYFRGLGNEKMVAFWELQLQAD